MHQTEPTEPASNWDFTPVLDLLRSPTYGDRSRPDHGPETIAPPHTRGQSREDVDSASTPVSETKPKQSHTRLGDFDSIWGLLNHDSKGSETKPTLSQTAQPMLDVDTQAPRPARVGTVLKRDIPDQPSYQKPTIAFPQSTSKAIPFSSVSRPQISDDTVAGSSLPSNGPQAFTVLKRAADTKSSSIDLSTAAEAPPRTPPKPIIGASNTFGTPAAKAKAKSDGKVDVMLSESSADADSDPSTIVFDRPITRKPGVLAFAPSQVGTPDARVDHYDTPPSSYDELDPALNDDTVRNIVSTPSGIRVLPVAYKNATDRRVGLMTKLLKDFPEYAQLVLKVGRLSAKKNDEEPRPIHVFVDMSNIMVGFHDSVKVSRNIPIATRIRRLHMSFSNFSLIMERGRPAAKRVLVGSDRLPSIGEAETLGYEANILDRVHKVKHSTPRMSKFRKGPGPQWASNGPETVGANENRWVEQGVDEILHLKILESLLDTNEPTTIVLATGDAAEAEYSGGFMRMVERALQRGWTVELVSFSQVTSNAYRRKDFRTKWGNRFRMIELDDYVEELFDST